MKSNLPYGWIKKHDKESGRCYYFNEYSGDSQWEKPKPEYYSPNMYAPKRLKLEMDTPDTPDTPNTPDTYMTAQENWIHEAKLKLRNQFPNLPTVIVNNAIEYANNQGSMYTGMSGRENGQDAIDAFYEMVLDGIQDQMKIVSEVFGQIMLMRERNRLQPSSSTLGSSVIGLPSRPLDIVSEKIRDFFEKK